MEVNFETLSLPNVESMESIQIFVGEGGSLTLSGPETVAEGQVIRITNGGTVHLPTVTEMTDVTVEVYSGGLFSAPMLTSLRAVESDTRLFVRGDGEFDAPLQSVVNVRLFAESGGLLDLPMLTNLNWTNRCPGGIGIYAQGEMAFINLPALLVIDIDSEGACAPINTPLTLNAYGDSTVSMPALESIVLGEGGEGETAYSDMVTVYVVGQNALMDLSGLAQFPEGRVAFEAYDGGVIQWP